MFTRCERCGMSYAASAAPDGSVCGDLSYRRGVDLDPADACPGICRTVEYPLDDVCRDLAMYWDEIGSIYALIGERTGAARAAARADSWRARISGAPVRES